MEETRYDVADFRGAETFIIQLNVDPNDSKSMDDFFILKSDDGSYEKKLTVKDDIIVNDDFLTLEFTDIKSNLNYTLIHNTGKFEVKIFFERSYKEIM